MRRKKPFVLSLIVGCYLLTAFMWWAILLHRETKEKFEIQRDILVEQDAEAVAALEKSYIREKQMIFGEAIVFVLALSIGFWIINRVHRKELAISKQQRNFLLSITHELKSPLSAIKLSLQTLMKRQLNQDQTNRLLENGLKESGRLENLVENILLSAKLDKPYTAAPKRMVLHPFLSSILEEIKSTYPQAELTLGVDLSNNSDGSVEFDAFSLRMVILNLIENAIKYNDTPMPKVHTMVSGDAQGLDIQVIDNGTGIPDKEKPNIFKQFYRIGQEDTRKTKGTGLGLYISKKLLEGIGASISVKDNQPRGSIFSVHIPNAS